MAALLILLRYCLFIYFIINIDIELDEYDDDNDGNFSSRNDYSHWSCFFFSCQCQFIHLSCTLTVYLQRELKAHEKEEELDTKVVSDEYLDRREESLHGVSLSMVGKQGDEPLEKGCHTVEYS